MFSFRIGPNTTAPKKIKKRMQSSAGSGSGLRAAFRVRLSFSIITLRLEPARCPWRATNW